MNCGEFEALLPDLNGRQMSGKPEYEAALAHARSCDQCSALLAEAESLEQGLRALATEDFSKQASARIEANLLREFRETKTAATRHKVNRQAAAIGIAAVALLALGVSLRYRPAQTAGRAPIAQTPAPVLQADVHNLADRAVAMKPELATSKAPTRSAHRPRPIPSQLQEVSGEAAAFITLPYADDPSTFDEGAVVRVEMPRAALASFGLPVAFAPSNDLVRADLLVAQDGTPQAIRLVSDNASNRLH